MVKSLLSTVQETPRTITADAGYWDTLSLQDPVMSGIEMLVAPDSKPRPPGSELPPNAPRSPEAFRMGETLATPEGKADMHFDRQRSNQYSARSKKRVVSADFAYEAC
jgi:hypothetical protein